ncbi:MAG: FAD-dependent oxidoreductase, partial [Firmicutes bacterium]|nr:FAD-dependent oxidoreductase [Bacillota bacterium]
GSNVLPKLDPDSGKSVAIIGGGPAGLTAAWQLRMKGHAVTIYDQMPHMGGMLRYGIPEYRLPKAVLDAEIANVEKTGVKMINNVNIGEDVTLSHIRNSYDAVLVAIGAWKSTRMNVPGEDLEGVVGGIDFLRDAATGKAPLMGKTVAIVGGGNTAMDACRSAVRLGADKVYNIYRRTRAEMPAEDIEIDEAGEEGVIFKYLTNPLEFLGENGKLSGVLLQKMQLGEPDESGRRSPVPIPGEQEELPLDMVIMALGQALQIKGLEELELNRKKNIAAAENTFETNLPGVFAAGDAIGNGASIAIEAIGEAIDAASVIDSYLAGEIIPVKKPYVSVREDITPETFADVERIPRVKMRHHAPELRRENFGEVNFGFSEAEARNEAARCLECGCHDYFECKLIDYARKYDVNPEKYEGEQHSRTVDNSHPFIDRNPDKCILCGLCVRVCDEVVGRAALGLTNRGFDTIIKPALDLPLAEAGCVSCGSCIALCPTGALGEKLAIEKSVPVKGEHTDAICSFCGLGCKTKMEKKGETLLRSRPEEGNILCSMGRFGFSESQRKDRINKPLILKDGTLTTVGFEEAFIYTAKRAQGVAMRYGADSVGVAVSERHTNEEAALIKKYANEILGTSNVFSFAAKESGLERTIGFDGSTVSPKELESAELIITICTDLTNKQLPLGALIRKAQKNGAKLVSVTVAPSVEADEWAEETFRIKDSTDFLREVLSELIKSADKNLPGYSELEASLSGISAGEDAKKLAELYLKAKKAVIIFAKPMITPAAAAAIGNMALLSGHIGHPREGIIQLKGAANAQGLYDLGIGEKKAETRALLVFGEDVPEPLTAGAEFLMVSDLYLTETAKRADVIIPAVSQLETKGSVTNAFGMRQSFDAVIPAKTGKSNADIIRGLAAVTGEKLADAKLPAVKKYKGEGKLVSVESDAIMAKPVVTNSVMMDFVKKYKH